MDSDSDNNDDVKLPSVEELRKIHINRLKKKVLRQIDEAIEKDETCIRIYVERMEPWLSRMIRDEFTRLKYEVDYDCEYITIEWSPRSKD